MTVRYEDVVIRRLRLDDLEAIQALHARQAAASDDAFSELRVTPRQHAWEMYRLRQSWIADQRYIAYVACAPGEEGELLLGYGAAVIEYQAHLFKVEVTASLGELWVEPEHRRHGVGRALVSSILEAVAARGITWVSVHLAGNAQEALPFFDKLQFRVGATELRLNLSACAQ
ncbi:MAG: GNAT family N-acetyltransferase [Proteobacteria bacterium]|nr:GNAT family N-acetyltransferase [Pseudomonadota bacterium]